MQLSPIDRIFTVAPIEARTGTESTPVEQEKLMNALLVLTNVEPPKERVSLQTKNPNRGCIALKGPQGQLVVVRKEGGNKAAAGRLVSLPMSSLRTGPRSPSEI